MMIKTTLQLLAVWVLLLTAWTILGETQFVSAETVPQHCFEECLKECAGTGSSPGCRENCADKCVPASGHLDANLWKCII
ncbi:hypothetical protein LINGRAHAP2_LOCUS8624 [Linum grandiflorum]